MAEGRHDLYSAVYTVNCTCCCLFSSLLAMIASILRRSEAEHLDWEMVTRSDGCGMTNRSALTSWYWEHARWNEDTAMQDKCFGWACNRGRSVTWAAARRLASTECQECSGLSGCCTLCCAAVPVQLVKYGVRQSAGRRLSAALRELWPR